MTDPTALLGFVIGIIGIIVSFVFYFRSKEQAKPVFRAGNIPLIGGNTPLLPADVEIIYRGENIKSLAKTYIAFWNAGRKTLLGTDVVPVDPIRFEISDPAGKILNARIIRETRKIDQARLEFTERTVQLKFDFFDSGDGVSLEIIHTDIGQDLECLGTIRGIPRGPRKASNFVPFFLSFGLFLTDWIDYGRINALIPGDLRKSRAGSNVTGIILGAIIPLIAVSVGAFGGLLLTTQSRLNFASNAANRVGGIMAVIFSVIVLTLVTTAIIQARQFRVPSKIGLTEREISDR